MLLRDLSGSKYIPTHDMVSLIESRIEGFVKYHDHHELKSAFDEIRGNYESSRNT